MKITCILASYNRPNWVRQALKSVAQQTHRDFELLVYDDSTILDIQSIVAEFSFPAVAVHHEDLTPARRLAENRLSVNCNRGLQAASGDLVCFLCDDDYYYPEWFAAAASFFVANEDKAVGFGRLHYSSSRDMVYPKVGEVRFFDRVVTNPSGTLDHNQVMHRRISPPLPWPESPKARTAPDGVYFHRLVKAGHLFHPIPVDAVVKRMHDKNLQKTHMILGTKAGEGSRE